MVAPERKDQHGVVVLEMLVVAAHIAEVLVAEPDAQ